MIQTVNVTSAVIVTTPQEVAIADARKALSMFRLDTINVPILGIVENMAYFTPAALPCSGGEIGRHKRLKELSTGRRKRPRESRQIR